MEDDDIHIVNFNSFSILSEEQIDTCNNEKINCMADILVPLEDKYVCQSWFASWHASAEEKKYLDNNMVGPNTIYEEFPKHVSFEYNK